jgi:hypothetical protein
MRTAARYVTGNAKIATYSSVSPHSSKRPFVNSDSETRFVPHQDSSVFEVEAFYNHVSVEKAANPNGKRTVEQGAVPSRGKMSGCGSGDTRTRVIAGTNADSGRLGYGPELATIPNTAILPNLCLNHSSGPRLN